MSGVNTGQEVFIVSAQRTAIGTFQGAFANTPATVLGATSIRAAMEKANVDGQQVDECIMGEVLTAGVGQAPARQSAILAGLPVSVPCMTINKVCGSGLKAIMLASDSITLGRTQISVAGGQENMTLAPHLLENSRTGYRLGSSQITDSLLKDGLWDPYNNFHMGNAAELCVKEHKISREQQDEFAKESYQRAQAAVADGHFKNEICTVEVKSRKAAIAIDTDEEPAKSNFDKMRQLRPAFDKEGTITAANASKINDGGAAVVLASGQKAKELGLQPLARIVSQAHFAHDPKWFTTAPVGAIKKSLELARLSIEDIDLFEINEAFSVVTMVAMNEFGIARDKVNVYGGAVALGHPIGASGARIFTTLVHALQQKNKQFGLATLCIGGGEAVSVIVERV